MLKFIAQHRAAQAWRSPQHEAQTLPLCAAEPSGGLRAGRLPQPNQCLALDDSAEPVQIATPHDCQPTFEDAVS